MLSPGEAALKYAESVKDGTTTSSNAMRRQAGRWLELVSSGKARYEPDVVDEVFAWVYRRIRLSHGVDSDGMDLAGKRFAMAPWQVWLVAMAMATRTEDDLYYDEIFISTGKGTSKSTLLAALILVHLAHPKYARRNMMIPVVCKDGEQAKETIFLELGKMAEAGDFDELVVERRSGNRYSRVVNERLGCYAVPFTRDSRTNKRGINVSMAVVDEYSDIPDNSAISQAVFGMKSGKGTTWFLTNGGAFREYPAFHKYRACKDMLESGADDRTCPVICEFDDPDKWREPDQWRRASPMLGVSIPLAYYEKRVAHAESNSYELPEFMRLLGGLWVRHSSGWIDIDLWTDEVEAKLGPGDFAGRRLAVGIDLSKRGDLTSYVVVAPDGKTESGQQKYIGYMRAYTCEGRKGLAEKSRKDKMNYEWLAENSNSMGPYITVCPGSLVDYRTITRDLAHDLGDSDAILYFDSRYKAEFDLADEEGLLEYIEHVMHPQSAQMNAAKPDLPCMSRSIDQTEEMVLEGRFRFVENPLMVAALGHCAMDERPGTKARCFDRKKSTGKYDPASALAMAGGGAVLSLRTEGGNYLADLGIAELNKALGIG